MASAARRYVCLLLLPFLLSCASPSAPHPSSLPHSSSSSPIPPWRTSRRRATLSDTVRRSGAREYPNLMQIATASYPNSAVAPYDWAYFPAEVPEHALVVRFEFYKQWTAARGARAADAPAVPLVCFALGSLPLPSEQEPRYGSLEAAARAAGGALSPFGGAMGAVAGGQGGWGRRGEGL
ncbi:hypothetical protein CLOP_g20096 [Closterium sp. NIES-67]|nr:hypothetical protein CLOP_g20096 [Closterium sp. NIES-67]